MSQNRVNKYNLIVPDPVPLKPRDLARVQRHALLPVARARLYPLERDAAWAERWRELAQQDVLILGLLGLVAVLLLILIVQSRWWALGLLALCAVTFLIVYNVALMVQDPAPPARPDVPDEPPPELAAGVSAETSRDGD